MRRVTDACGLEATGYGGYDSLVHTMYPALHQACGMPPRGRLTGLASTWLSTVSFPAAPALYSLNRRQPSSAPGSGATGYFSSARAPRDSHCLLLRLLLAPCGEDSCVALGLAWCLLPLFTTVRCLTACHLPSAPSTSLRWGTARAPGTVLMLSWAWCPVENHYSHLDLPCPRDRSRDCR